MLSTSKLGNFCLAQPKTNDKLYKKHKYTPHMISPYEQYKLQLTSNVCELKKKYPTVDVQYIKSLLQQLQNNVQMVSDILDQEHKKHLKNSMQQQRSDNESNNIFEIRKQKNQILKVQDVKILQKSVVKLFKKFTQEKRQKQQLIKKLTIFAKQNQNLKLMNQQLMTEQMQQSMLFNNQDIY